MIKGMYGEESGKCPKCGYPTCFDGKNYFGLYFAGRVCDGCGYLDEEAKKKAENKKLESELRVATNRLNIKNKNKTLPKPFKRVTD